VFVDFVGTGRGRDTSSGVCGAKESSGHEPTVGIREGSRGLGGRKLEKKKRPPEGISQTEEEKRR